MGSDRHLRRRHLRVRVHLHGNGHQGAGHHAGRGVRGHVEPVRGHPRHAPHLPRRQAEGQSGGTGLGMGEDPVAGDELVPPGALRRHRARRGLGARAGRFHRRRRGQGRGLRSQGDGVRPDGGCDLRVRRGGRLAGLPRTAALQAHELHAGVPSGAASPGRSGTSRSSSAESTGRRRRRSGSGSCASRSQ